MAAFYPKPTEVVMAAVPKQGHETVIISPLSRCGPILAAIRSTIMDTDQTRRRFIAGAVCPRCALMDKILVDMDTDQRLCVSCGFSEERPGLPEESPVVAMAPKLAELPTRVSRAAARRVETPAERVTLIDLQPSGDTPQGE